MSKSTLATSPRGKNLVVGDLVTSDFDNDYMMTYTRVPIYKEIPCEITFYRGDIGIVISIVSTPDSLYTTTFAQIILPKGTCWVPSRWIRLV
jgi:hypothetical protein